LNPSPSLVRDEKRVTRESLFYEKELVLMLVCEEEKLLELLRRADYFGLSSLRDYQWDDIAT
jgi:hypothetical protein